MVAFNKFNSFVAAVANKVHNLGADSLRVMLTNVAPIATNTVRANLTEIAAGNGYTSGGFAVTITGSTQTAGVYKLVGNDIVFTATGAVGPFQYAVLYNDTATNKELIGWWIAGSPVTLANTDPYTLDFDQAGGILTIT